MAELAVVDLDELAETGAAEADLAELALEVEAIVERRCAADDVEVELDEDAEGGAV